MGDKLKQVVVENGGDPDDPESFVARPPKSKRMTYVDPDAGLSANQKRRKQSAQFKAKIGRRHETMVRMKSDVEDTEKNSEWGIDLTPKPEPKKRDGPEFRLLIRHEIQRGQDRSPSPEERSDPANW